MVCGLRGREWGDGRCLESCNMLEFSASFPLLARAWQPFCSGAVSAALALARTRLHVCVCATLLPEHPPSSAPAAAAPSIPRCRWPPSRLTTGS